uniref:CARD domain-containing protein n=1 Tax=Plectus sambesii TaxID=2011161 RepID=A0A914X511_9BILA
MDTVKQDALKHCAGRIADTLEVNPVLDHLSIILTNEEVEIIKAKPTRSSQSRELIDCLKRKGEQQQPFERLMEALSSYSVGQGWLGKEIQAKYDHLRVSQPCAAEANHAKHNQNAQSAEEFDAAMEVEKIITKFKKVPKIKLSKLDKPLTKTLIEGLSDSREEMAARIDLEDLINIHMSSVLTDSAVKKIRNAPSTSNAFYVFSEALTNGSILALLKFLSGLKSTKQGHLFHLFCTEEFCNELVSVTDNI